MSEAAVRYATREEGNVIHIVPQRLKKDGSAKHTVCNKKAGVKSEVYPFTPEDMHRVLEYFAGHGNWLSYLAFVASCNLARRAGDILALTWGDLYDERTGDFRADLRAIQEEKTGKFANPHISQAVKDAINLYCEKTGCDPKADYDAPVFLQLSGNYRGRIMSYSAYLKSLKRAAADLKIAYNVGSHSARKTYGTYSVELHAGDPLRMNIMQKEYNHSSEAVTADYINVTKKKADKYHDDFGDFFTKCAVNGEEVSFGSDSPVVHVASADLRELLKLAYAMGMENANTTDPQVHINAFAELEEMAESMKK